MNRYEEEDEAVSELSPTSMNVTRFLTDFPHVESLGVGLQEEGVVDVDGEDDAVLLLLVRAVGVLAADPGAVAVQLTGDLLQMAG